MSEHHMIAAVDWLCYTHTADPLPARQILKEWEQHGRPSRLIIPKKNTPPSPEPDSPAHYGTGLSGEGGRWTRKGWAGRTARKERNARPRTNRASRLELRGLYTPKQTRHTPRIKTPLLGYYPGMF